MLTAFLAGLQLITFNLGEPYTLPPEKGPLEVYKVNQETLVLKQTELAEDEPAPVLYDSKHQPIHLGEFSNSMYDVLHIDDFNNDGLSDVLIEGNTGASSYNTTTYLITSQGKGKYTLQTFYQFAHVYRFPGDKTLHIAAYGPADVKYAQDVSHAMWTYWPVLYSWQPGKHRGVYKENMHRDFYTQKVRQDYQKEIASLQETLNTTYNGHDDDTEKAIKARQAAIALIHKKFRK